MVDLSSTIHARSDQMNAVDLIGGPITIVITKVTATGAKDQPTAVHYEGGDGKPYKPCLSMRRLLVWAWGHEGDEYGGRQLILYNDLDVEWAGQKEGGIRISHMSHIDENGLSIMLPVKRGKKAKYTVQAIKAPIKPSASEKAPEQPQEDPAEKYARVMIGKVLVAPTPAAIDELLMQREAKLAELKTARPDLHDAVTKAIDERRFALAAADDDGDF